MDINGCYLTIESVKKVSTQSFVKFITINMMRFIEDNKGDFTILETNAGHDHFEYLISLYEEGERL